MNSQLKIPLIAAWVALVLAFVLRVSLGAGNILAVFTAVIALSVTGIFITPRGSGTANT